MPQGPQARSQEPLAKPYSPLTKPQGPLVRPQEPLARSQEPPMGLMGSALKTRVAILLENYECGFLVWTLKFMSFFSEKKNRYYTHKRGS